MISHVVVNSFSSLLELALLEGVTVFMCLFDSHLRLLSTLNCFKFSGSILQPHSMWTEITSVKCDSHKSSFPPTEPTSGCVVLTLFALPAETVSGALVLFGILHCVIRPWGTLSIKTTVMNHRNWNVELTEQNWLWNFNFFQNYFFIVW